ncbi:hypothetical protein [Roseimaritima ulvae]|nr:hypothetical protein [Roseimaritima ulvae]
MPPSDPGDPPEGPNEGPTDELPGEIPPLPPGEPEIPPDFPGETPTGGGTDGTLGDMPPTDVPPTDIPPTDVPPSDIPPSDDPPFDGPPEDIPPEDIPPGEGTFGGGNTGATEFYVKELKIVPQGYSQGYDGSQVPPLYEGSMAEIRGKIDGPREYGELLPPPQLTLQADLNSDGDFDDPHEQAYSGPDSGMYFYGEEFSWSFPLVDDGPVPGDGEAQNVITVRAFFGTLVEGEAGTTDRFVSPDQDLSPDDMPQPPADDGPPITLATADVLNVDPYWTRPPELSWQTDEDGNPVAAWSIGYQDVGKLDAHRLQVRWGEGPAELLDAEPEAHEDCEEVLQGMPCEHEHTVLVTQQVPATAQEAESVTLTVADDDTGTADYTILNLDVIRNNDDDDQNERSDFLDSGHESEDDLVELDLTNFMTSEMDPQSDDYREGEFQLQYNGQNIHIWDSPAKDRFILPAGMLMEDALDMAYELYPGTEIVPYTGQEHVWVEGLQPSVNDVYLSYSYVGDPAGFAEHQAVRFLGQAQITVWGIDVDIDSDNNDGFDYPKNTQWEEYIEAHPFSLGKLIQPDDTHFTPIRLRLPPGLDPFDPTIRVELSNTDPDYLSLWNTHKADPVRDIENFLPLGDYILAELNYDPATGGITVWAEALVGIYDKMRDVAIAGVDEHVVTASLRGPQLPEPVEDEVKYKPVKPNSFFPRYIQERSWRNAVAADLVYGDRGPIGTDTPGNNAHPIDGPQFGQRYVREPELKEYLDTVTLHEDRVLDDDMKQFILDVIYYRYSTNNNPDGDGVRDLRVALYRDYNSGDYTLSYQGTNFFALEDWLVNLSQGIGATTDQYAAAQVLASYLGKANFQGLNLTGQSLGGGLASAGALASGIHADTFNAAGLSFNALWDNSHPDHRLEIVPGSSVRYARSARYITAYHVWMNPLFKEPDESRMINVPDILTFLQRNTRAVVEILGHKIPNMPNAVGRAVPIEGQYNIDTELEEKAWNKGWVAWAAYDVKLNSTFEMGMSHLFPSIYYGLMHGLNADGTEWNVFDNRATR